MVDGIGGSTIIPPCPTLQHSDRPPLWRITSPRWWQKLSNWRRRSQGFEGHALSTRMRPVASTFTTAAFTVFRAARAGTWSTGGCGSIEPTKRLRQHISREAHPVTAPITIKSLADRIGLPLSKASDDTNTLRVSQVRRGFVAAWHKRRL